MMKKSTYEAPEAIVVCLENVDVITASLPVFKDDDILDDGWISA